MSDYKDDAQTTTGCPPGLSFAKDIAGFFTQQDIDHMKQATGGNLDLSNYNDVKIWAHKIYSETSSGDMPPAQSGEPAWTQQMLTTFNCWMQQGCQP